MVLALVMFLIGGLTFFMSLQEPPLVSKKQIVKIQNRYAKLVLDAFEIEKRKKKKEEVKPPPPEVKKPVEIPKPKKEEPKVKEEVKKEIKIEIPKVIERKVKKYEIRKEKLQIAELEKEVKIEALPELPDVLDKKSNRYGAKKESAMIGLDDDMDSGLNLGRKGPDIDLSRSSKYGGGRKRSAGLDLMEDRSTKLRSKDPQIDTRSVKRYKAKSGRRSGSGRSSVVADVGERKVLLARKAPDTKVVVGKRYGGGGYKRSVPVTTGSKPITIKEKGAILKKNGKIVSLPETASIQNLEACVDPNEEKRLKKKIVTRVDDRGSCTDKWGSYAYLGTEMFSTLEIRFVSSANRKYNRCEALNMALQCLINNK